MPPPPLILEDDGITDWRMTFPSAAMSFPGGPPANAQFALKGRRRLGGRSARLLGGNEGGAENADRLSAVAEAISLSLFIS